MRGAAWPPGRTHEATRSADVYLEHRSGGAHARLRERRLGRCGRRRAHNLGTARQASVGAACQRRHAILRRRGELHEPGSREPSAQDRLPKGSDEGAPRRDDGGRAAVQVLLGIPGMPWPSRCGVQARPRSGLVQRSKLRQLRRHCRGAQSLRRRHGGARALRRVGHGLVLSEHSDRWRRREHVVARLVRSAELRGRG